MSQLEIIKFRTTAGTVYIEHQTSSGIDKQKFKIDRTNDDPNDLSKALKYIEKYISNNNKKIINVTTDGSHYTAFITDK
ncbi:MAG: hypothetical protein ACW967_03965 [Candidatus Hodarchaeales archaeon]|jgi:hypothetical protein